MTEAEEEIIRTVITRFIAQNPETWNAWLSLREQQRMELADPRFGSMSKDGAMRHVASVPALLDARLRAAAQRLFGSQDYLTGKRGRAFLKKFPIFQIVDKL